MAGSPLAVAPARDGSAAAVLCGEDRDHPSALDRCQLGLLAAAAAAVPVSIFASEALLLLGVAVLALRIARGRASFCRTAVDVPLFAFTVWTLLAASFAAEPLVSHEDAKKLLLFSLFYVALDVVGTRPRRDRVVAAVLLGGLALAGSMVVQHHFLGFDRLDRRPHGFLGHYMSAAGVTMITLLLAASRVAMGGLKRPHLRDFWLAGGVLLGVGAVAYAGASARGTLLTRLFVAGLVVLAARVALSASESVRRAEAALAWAVVPVAAWALLVSQTRSVWIGGLLGLTALTLLKAPRLLMVLAAGIALVLTLHPAPLKGRLTVTDASSVDRYYMWQAGIDMVLERPVFGMGPGMILASYPRYRWPEAPNPNAPHLHNNPLQVAAERGVPAFVFLAWWATLVLAALLREARSGSATTVGAFTAVVATFAAGLFEYNLGDSEVLMLVLLLTAIPFALARERVPCA